MSGRLHEGILPSIFQVLPKHWLWGIHATVDDGCQQAFVRSCRFRER